MAQIPCFVMELGMLLSADNTGLTRSLLTHQLIRPHATFFAGDGASCYRLAKGTTTLAIIRQWHMAPRLEMRQSTIFGQHLERWTLTVRACDSTCWIPCVTLGETVVWVYPTSHAMALYYGYLPVVGTDMQD
jgi:hypothetical protein